MNVSDLVSQMNETLSTIHSTIASLNTTAHDARLDDLERQRDLAISSLDAAFAQETEALSQRRLAERDEIAERRRLEDEELERRRRAEDEQLAEVRAREDAERRDKLGGKARCVEEETDELMASVEEEARRMLEEGRDSLRLLEEKRKELNCLIDEQLKIPLPPAPTRRRSTRAGVYAPPVMAAESKPLAPAPADELVGNLDVKAPEEGGDPDGKASTDGQRLASEVEAQKNETVPGLEGRGRIPDPEQEHGDTRHMSASEDQTPQHKSLFGSWGKTMRTLVRGQPGSRTSLPNEEEPRTNPSDLESDRRESTPGSFPVEETTPVEEAFVSAPEPPPSPEVRTAEVLDEEAIQQEHVQLPDAEIETDVAEIGNDTGLDARDVNANLSMADAQGHQADHIAEKHGECEEPTCSTDDVSPDGSTASGYERRFGMSGNEAIPGTMTHGCADLENEAVEAIPGTMTHGNDSPALEPEMSPEPTNQADCEYRTIDGPSTEVDFIPAPVTVDLQEAIESPTIDSSDHLLSDNGPVASVEGETLDSIAEAEPKSPGTIEHQPIDPSEGLCPGTEVDSHAAFDETQIEALGPEVTQSPVEQPSEEPPEMVEVDSSVEDSRFSEAPSGHDAVSGLNPSAFPDGDVHEVSGSASAEQPTHETDGSLAHHHLINETPPIMDSELVISEVDHGEYAQEGLVSSRADAADGESPSHLYEETMPVTQQPLDDAHGLAPQDDYQSSDDASSLRDSLDTAETHPDQDTTTESVPLPTTDATSAGYDEPIRATNEHVPELEPGASPADVSDYEDDAEPKHHDSTNVWTDDRTSGSNAKFARPEASDEPDPNTSQTGSQDIEPAVGGPEPCVADRDQEEVAGQDAEHVRADQEEGPVMTEEVDQGVAHALETGSYSASGEDYHHDDDASEQERGNFPSDEDPEPPRDIELDGVDDYTHPFKTDEYHEERASEQIEASQPSEPAEDRGDHESHVEESTEAAFEEATHTSDTIPLPNGTSYDEYEERTEGQNQRHISGDGQPEVFYHSIVENDADRESLRFSESNADTGSQPFVTPLASAGFRSPLNFEDERGIAEEELSYSDEANSQYEQEDEYSTTVHGQEDLFEDNSDESVEEVADDVQPEMPADSHHDSGDSSVKEQVITSDVPHPGDDDEPMTAVPVNVEHLGNDLGDSPDDGEHVSTPTPHWLEEPPNPISDPVAVEAQPGLEEDQSQDADHDSMGGPAPDQQATPPFRPTKAPVTPDAGPMLLSPSTPSAPDRGLAGSRHNPDRPRTPPRREARRSIVNEGSEPFAPRDVTDIPWHSRNDSIPQSLHSQSTISSSPLSSTDSPLRIDSHEPAIHDASPAYAHSHLLSGITGRPRGDSRASSSFDQFGYDANKGLAGQWLRRESETGGPRLPQAFHQGGDDDHSYNQHRNSVGSSSSGSLLFQKMRSIFEQTGGADAAHAGTPQHFTAGPALSARGGSPARSRPASWAASHPAARKVGIVAPPAGGFGVGSAAEVASVDDDDDDDGGYGHGRGLFRARGAGEADERSSLLDDRY